MTARPPRILFASNGHGEDDISCKVLDAFRALGRDAELEAWPMVGQGRAYAARGIRCVGPRNALPSEGFGTLSVRALWRDLRAGFLGLILRQIRFAREIRGRYDLIVATGDIVPLASGRLSETPMLFISCAKSAYYDGRDGHTPTEKRLMRSLCRQVFPRDRLTAERLQARGVPNRYLGNPMMDGLDPVAPEALRGEGTVNVAMLAGSRQDAAENALVLLAAGVIAAKWDETPDRMRFLFAAHESLDFQEVEDAAPDTWQRADWEGPLPGEGDVLSLRHDCGARALFVKRRFADVLHASDLAVGMAGTANEQAMGLGLPLIVAPGLGNQGDAYLRMKMPYYGDAALRARRDPKAIAQAIRGVMSDPEMAATMIAAGRERMGEPGASRAIAEALAAELDAMGRA